MKKVILITGVSSGFGKATAEALAAKGHIVYGTVRRDCEVHNSVHVLKMDLTKQESISNAVSEIIGKEGRIDVVINNAGMHTGGPIETAPIEHLKLQIDTNFTGTVMVIREVLPHMRNKGKGTIINFSSIGGLMGLPFQGFYSAGKFAIEGLSEALRMELKQFNIKVVLINPGDFHTNNSANRRNFLAPNRPENPYYEQFKTSLEQIEKDESGGWKPDILAKKLVKIAESDNPKQRYIISSFEQKLAVALKYILPGKIFRQILESHYKIK